MSAIPTQWCRWILARGSLRSARRSRAAAPVREADRRGTTGPGGAGTLNCTSWLSSGFGGDTGRPAAPPTISATACSAEIFGFAGGFGAADGNGNAGISTALFGAGGYVTIGGWTDAGDSRAESSRRRFSNSASMSIRCWAAGLSDFSCWLMLFWRTDIWL